MNPVIAPLPGPLPTPPSRGEGEFRRQCQDVPNKPCNSCRSEIADPQLRRSDPCSTVTQVAPIRVNLKEPAIRPTATKPMNIAIHRDLASRLMLAVAACILWTFECKTALPQTPTKVVQISPRDGATNVNQQNTVEIHFSNGLKLTTIHSNSIRLLNAAALPVRSRLGSDIEADVVHIQPADRLTPHTSYTVEVNGALVDKEGVPVAPFRSSFTTGAEVPPTLHGQGFQFAKTKVDEEPGPTAIAVGPDGHVYVATYYGSFYRLRINPTTGLSVGKEKLLTLPGTRKILGLVFDPQATATNLAAWLTSDERKAENLDVGTFSGTVSKLSIPAAGRSGSATETRYIVGLPSGWHPLNGCTFGPDKRLYISVGSMNRLGDDPVRPETPLSAALVVADVRSPGFNGGRLPLNVQTTAPVNYDPSAASAPLELYATGFREMYRPCWHSNGNLYGGVNQNDGTGRADTPSGPGVPSLHSVFPDEDLVRIVQGGYYGHPNPSRKQYVLLGGNPTAGLDPWDECGWLRGVHVARPVARSPPRLLLRRNPHASYLRFQPQRHRRDGQPTAAGRRQ